MDHRGGQSNPVIRFPPSPKDQKNRPRRDGSAQFVFTAGLLAILQLDEDLAIAAVLAVECL